MFKGAIKGNFYCNIPEFDLFIHFILTYYTS